MPEITVAVLAASVVSGHLPSLSLSLRLITAHDSLCLKSGMSQRGLPIRDSALSPFEKGPPLSVVTLQAEIAHSTNPRV